MPALPSSGWKGVGKSEPKYPEPAVAVRKRHQGQSVNALFQRFLDHVAPVGPRSSSGDNTSGFCSRQTHAPTWSPSAGRTISFSLYGLVRADRMHTKLIVNGIVENQRQEVERDDAAQRARQRVAESLQIGVPGDRLGKIEKRLVDFRIRKSPYRRWYQRGAGIGN